MRRILSGLILVVIIVGAYILANGGLTETASPDGVVLPQVAPDASKDPNPPSNKNFNL